MRIRITVILFYLLSGFCNAQTLTGTIRDARTNRILPEVTVQLLQTTKGAITNKQGYFIIYNVPRGSYVMRLRSVGYQLAEEPITMGVRADVNTTIRLQPSAVQLNQQTVTSIQRAETPDFNRPEVTTVVSNRDLRQQPPRTISEALFGSTGVWIQKTDHAGGAPFIRGLTGQQTLLLVDGIRLNNAITRSGPNPYLNTIDPQSVGQVEVLRSSGSVAYGSDAIGGVVNVLTKTPQFSDQPRFQGSLFAKAMTQGMDYSGRAEVGFGTRSFAFLGGFAYRSFGDLVAGKGLGRETPTGYNQISGDVKTLFRLSNRYVATIAYQNGKLDNVPVYHQVRSEDYAYYRFNPQRRQLAYARLEGFYNRRFLGSVQLTASWQRQTEGRQSQMNGSISAIQERDQTTTTGLTLLAKANPNRFWQMQNGLEWYYDRVRSSGEAINTQTGAVTTSRGLYPDRASMNSLAAFSLHTLSFNRLMLTGGGRYNMFWIQTTEPPLGKTIIRPSALVGNLGISYAVMPVIRVVASIQSAFRVPNVNDLGARGMIDYRYEGINNTLQPERSFNKEIGLKVRTSRFSATVLAYHNQLTNFISLVRTGMDSVQGYPVYLKQNIAEGVTQGIEAEVEGEIATNWLANAGVTYTYGQNSSPNEPFRRIPPLNGRVRLTYQPQTNWWARAELLWAGAQTRLSQADLDDNRIAKGGTPAWQVINVNAGYRWEKITLSAEFQNLTNEAYRTHGSGVDGIGRSAWASLLISL
ncbi:TonB-dependent receptor [Spirosoma endbachense]|uniref:TonB-dependent receptor n=1 Tax=Spirosoma endbachense TaxID=2666025 RepID=A0A6P1VLL9_9BACT|nr:TonB-dependent receptor [Spirosoma endbachense]QHV93585.1 TonB-dependent receptor [Spirosoma endbachense]